MKERPILFSAPMVRAILDGSKTQTRQIAKGVVARHARTGEALSDLDSAGPRVSCPYGQPGDRLWVRETWQAWRRTSYEYDEWEVCDVPPSQIIDEYGELLNIRRRRNLWDRGDPASTCHAGPAASIV